MRKEEKRTSTDLSLGDHYHDSKFAAAYKENFCCCILQRFAPATFVPTYKENFSCCILHTEICRCNICTCKDNFCCVQTIEICSCKCALCSMQQYYFCRVLPPYAPKQQTNRSFATTKPALQRQNCHSFLYLLKDFAAAN